MSVYNQPRRRVIQMIFLGMILIIGTRLFWLQVIEKKYAKLADANAVLRKVVYPSRGIILDRKGRSILSNDALYDLVVTPANIKKIDTAYLCEILQINHEEYLKRLTGAIVKNGRVRPSVFAPLLQPAVFGRLQESMFLFQPGFELVQRQIRSYPYAAAANFLGYIAEIPPDLLKKPEYADYNQGDYMGLTGLERTYQKELMGQRGIQYLVKDNLNRTQGSYEKGEFDTAAIAGKNLRLSLDIDLQMFGEKLMKGKIGSVVALDPKTGGILAMVSGPSFDPNLLTGPFRNANFSRLFTDTTKPLLNRAIQATYPPGSTFKPMTAMVALDEGVITPSFGYPCTGAYYGCNRPIKCEHHDAGHAANLRLALAHSCNAYFSHVYRLSVDAQKFGGIKVGGMHKWWDYMSSFGLGHRIGVDIPSESRGTLPDTSYFNKRYNGSWNSCTNVFLGIGQGELTLTPLQMANEMCIISNRGYFFIPHFVDKIDGDNSDVLNKFKEKHVVARLADTTFGAVIRGMQDVIEAGTGVAARIDGITMGGKTGTAENYAIVNGERTKLKNHSIFVAFAPVENPKICIAVVVENAGFGATYAAPIASFMIEKYLNDTIAAKRQPLVDKMINTVTISPAMLQKSKLDSLNRIQVSTAAADAKARPKTL
ncbi:peptidoglycan glycosyltransferase [Chitinophaga costaii]|uniref:Peptidoglycan glycosyltransferase n=1 Tax=Chitinophaga costaii TaxID=1335309 RepID=A0A1C4DPD7_9BACT|nr:penicillin-binding protein 2 [Chitinophaga costaii]PUZ27726.1 penicillin-binding protein 2 [Chitinophaga costaii]SCC33233.1 peptidoglycan glycosyltransferase [Chitinophaga costaii]